MDTNTLIEQALQNASMGRVDEAEQMVRQVLQTEPANSDAMCVLAIAEHTRGRTNEARQHIDRAIEIDGESFWYRMVLGEVISKIDPVKAIDAFGEALRIQPDLLEASRPRATLLAQAGRFADATNEYRRWIELAPNDPIAHHGLAISLHQLGSFEESGLKYDKAVELDPQNLAIRAGLALSFLAQGKHKEAITAAEHLVQRAPQDRAGYYLLGRAFQAINAYDHAAEAYAHAAERDQGDVDSRWCLANLLARRGEVAAALEVWRDALALAPEHYLMHSTLLYHLNYDPSLSAQQIFDEHVRWAQKFAEPLTRAADMNHPNDRDADRPLRVGYVSPDFMNHPVAAFMESILWAHRPDRIVSVCLSDVAKDDAYTERLKTLAGEWHSIVGLTDEQVAQRVRDLKIDVLVDLVGHLPNNRLLAFARKPSPVQVTYLGYCNTTGMSAMDWTFVDDITDPPDDTQPYTEKLIRLPQGFACYNPKAAAVEPGRLPASNEGFVAFGVFHRPHKLNDAEIELLARVLDEVPTSKILFWRDLLFGRSADRLRSRLRQRGIDDSRYQIRGDQPPTGTHMGMYFAVDIALDVQPWSGHTTACESLWMGVPYVTMRGKNHAGRMAASAVTHAGFEEFVAKDRDDYVAIAKRLAGDVAGLAKLRGRLRARMAESELCDATGFTAEFEDALRTAWRAWCDK